MNIAWIIGFSFCLLLFTSLYRQDRLLRIHDESISLRAPAAVVFSELPRQQQNSLTPVAMKYPSSEQYLYPFLVFGPNNQILGLRSAALLARRLNRTLIIPEIQTHYLNGPKTFLHTEELLEFSSGGEYCNTISLLEFKQRFSGHSLSIPDYSEKEQYFQYALPDLSSHNISLSSAFQETLSIPEMNYYEQRSRHIHFSTPPHRFPVILVRAFTLFNTFRLSENKKTVPEQSGIHLHRSLYDRAQSLQKHGLSECFVCLHMRPYPDSDDCFQHFGEDDESIPAGCSEKMSRPGEFRSKLLKAVSECGGSTKAKVFVAHHPLMNLSNIRRITRDLDIVTLEDLLEEDETIEPNRKSFEEQAICSISDYFVWSPFSSWSINVQYERMHRFRNIWPKSDFLQRTL